MKDIKFIYKDEFDQLSVQFPSRAEYISGMDILVQIVALAYLTDPGQDLNDPETGSGVRSIIGQIDIQNEDNLKADFLSRTSKIEAEIIERQTDLDIPPNERLQGLEVRGMQVDPLTLELNAGVKIYNQQGENRVVNI